MTYVTLGCVYSTGQ